MVHKNLYMLTLIFLILPIRGCKNEAISPSIIEYDCRRDVYETLIPGTPGISIKASRCIDYVFKPDKMSVAISLFVKSYSQIFDLSQSEVWDLISGLTIEVSVIPKTVANVYSIDGKFLNEKTPVSGLAYSEKLIWVEIKTNQIWSSSLIHELVHIVIWRSNGVHGDPDHEGSQFSGWNSKHTKLIKDINVELLELDI